ncbi:MAG: hypothetical protein DRP26_04755 [Candidatus Zixiibacteriota bacterium]|nr:MAG: hypothetical protein DRP26_04755 [candidate division Zixibacteria bacterium]
MLSCYKRFYYRYLFIISLSTPFILLMFFFSCGPKPAFKMFNVAYDLKVKPVNRGGILSWRIYRQEDSPISGYNIYIAESSDSEGWLYNKTPYPGDTDGDINLESIELMGLENGRRYYVFIRTVFPDGKLSRPSVRVEFTPLFKGRLEISQNHTTIQSGYSFAKERYTKARSFDNDFYIYATSSKMGISSPSRLHPDLRITLINKVDNLAKGSFEQTQPLIKGETYILKTADGGTARLKVVKITGKPPLLKVVLDFVYYPPGVKP